MSFFGGNFNNFGGGRGGGRYPRAQQNNNMRFGILPLMRPNILPTPQMGGGGGGHYRGSRPQFHQRGGSSRFRTPGRGEVVRLGPSKPVSRSPIKQEEPKKEQNQHQLNKDTTAISKNEQPPVTVANNEQPPVKKETDVKTEIKQEKEDLPLTKVELDRYNSELHIRLSNNNLVGEIMKGEGFHYMWGGVRATHGVKKGKVCFEVHILEYDKVDLPEEKNPCVARVGWSVDGSDYQLGEDKLSWGYGGTGKSSNDSKFRDYGKAYGAGDVITCYVDLETTPKAIFFALNGEYLGVAFRFTNELGDKALYPHVTIKNIKFHVNFGNEPPKFPLSNGFKMIGQLPKEDVAMPLPGPKSLSETEVIMMVGLPGSGKSYWCEKYSKEHPEKKYYILGTNLIIDRMKVTNLLRKRNYHGRWEELIKRASGVLNKLFIVAKQNHRNYILDQTNVYFTARRRKMESFKGYWRKGVVIVNTPRVLAERMEKQRQIEGKIIPDSAIGEMKKNFTLPEVGPSFDEVIYVEEPLSTARELVQSYRKEGESLKRLVSSGDKRESPIRDNRYAPDEKRPKVEGGTPHRPDDPHNERSDNRGHRDNSKIPPRRDDSRSHRDGHRDDHRPDHRERYPRDDTRSSSRDRRDREERDSRSRHDDRSDRGRSSYGNGRKEENKPEGDIRNNRFSRPEPRNADLPRNRYSDGPVRPDVANLRDERPRNDRSPYRREHPVDPVESGPDRSRDRGQPIEERSQDIRAYDDAPAPREPPYRETTRNADPDFRRLYPEERFGDRRPPVDRPRDLRDDARERDFREGPRDRGLREPPRERDFREDPRERDFREGPQDRDFREGVQRDGYHQQREESPPQHEPYDRKPLDDYQSNYRDRGSYDRRPLDAPPPRRDAPYDRYREDRRMEEPFKGDDVRESNPGDDYFDRPSVNRPPPEGQYDERATDPYQRDPYSEAYDDRSGRYPAQPPRRDDYRREEQLRPMRDDRYDRPPERRPYNGERDDDYQKGDFISPRSEYDDRNRRPEPLPQGRSRDEGPRPRSERDVYPLPADDYRSNDRYSPAQQPRDRSHPPRARDLPYRGDVPYTGPERQYEQNTPRSYPDTTNLSNSGKRDGYSRNLSGSYQTQMTTSTANYGHSTSATSSNYMRSQNPPPRDIRDSNPRPRDPASYPSRDLPRYGGGPSGSERNPPPPQQPSFGGDRDSYEKQQEDYQKAYSQWYANYAQAFAELSKQDRN